jgi:pimeloyl-ACP methyl ester carboxylesterase
MERSITTSDGCTLTYWLRRTSDQPAPVILMIHGAASNHTRWSEFVDSTTLTTTWDLLRPDMRGNGQSFYRGRLDLDVWSRDLALLLDAEKYSKALLVGHSLGAQIAIQFAHDHPDRVQGLALIDPVVRAALIGRKRTVSRSRPLFRAAVWIIRCLNALGLRRREIPDRDLRELDRETRIALQDGQSAEEIAERYSAVGPILQYQPTANYLQQLIATTASLPELETITVPVAILLSTGITFADLRTNREALEHFPDVEFTSIDANHWPLTESPYEVRVAIEEWVAERFPTTPPIKP